MGAEVPEDDGSGVRRHGPEDEALLGDSVGTAPQVVLDTLEPRERLAFVLHDLFGVRVAFGFTITPEGRISRIDLMAEPSALAGLPLEIPGA